MVVPQIADRPYWAGRVAELGIGAARDGPTPTIDSLRPRSRTALPAETARTCAGRGAAIRADGARAAKLVLDASYEKVRAHDNQEYQD